MRLCRKRLETAGVDLKAYTIPAVVEDLEAARLALGYERVDLLSESYGTRVAQTYASLHGDSLYRSVMIGVNPPGRFVWEPAMVDAQIEHYSRLWADDPALRARLGNLAEVMCKVAHAMPPRWRSFPIDPGKVNAVAFVLLFHRKTAAKVFDAYVAAGQGDPSGLALMSLAYDFTMPKSLVWGDLFAKGGSADFDPGRDYTATLRSPESIIGSPLSLLIRAALAGLGIRNASPTCVGPSTG
jgi:pimeloyl-ACP methyl ester carboxylesterase